MSRRGPGSWRFHVTCLVVVLSLIAAPWLIAKGAYNLWAQHTGIPATIELKVEKCGNDTGSLFELPGGLGGNSRYGGYKYRDCPGTWKPDGVTKQKVLVYGVEPPTFRTVEARVHGDLAYTDSLYLPAPLLFGAVALVFALYRIWSWWRSGLLRRRRASHDGPESPYELR